jgi:putative glutamine amidotransferase
VSRPLIGVTTSELRHTHQIEPTPEGEPGQTEMALGLRYLQAVEQAGGIPVVLPPLRPSAIGSLLARLCGLLLSGGPDLDPAGYGARAHALLGPTEPGLDAFEVALARRADRQGIPILGICRGAQALNISRGGTLHQHLPDVTDGTIAHRQSTSGMRTAHEVTVAPGTLLASVVGAGPIAVNSFHHQAIDRLGRGLRAVAWSPDGMIEAVEAPGREFVLGVQWHAETLVHQRRQRELFRRLVLAADTYFRADPPSRASRPAGRTWIPSASPPPPPPPPGRPSTERPTSRT